MFPELWGVECDTEVSFVTEHSLSCYYYHWWWDRWENAGEMTGTASDHRTLHNIVQRDKYKHAYTLKTPIATLNIRNKQVILVIIC